ncbi:hypothetical protein JOD57_000805 [Geodermatophilus bullaregiensis]|uniref:hypothetical protein n=1 Tax=Geodermatophilus bullaregiensis TaxID=1564160 RepID=UPI001958A529|nr:hypothetical protein [Geodermatophilus bullaregiensis]MBM7804968.1 hypothetical protein [Geodermatophilus bullaregiensis]
MRVAAGVLFVIACLAELGSVVLIVREARTAAGVLRRWQRADNPANQEQGTWAQVLLINEVVRTLLDARVRIASAVALLVVGILAGTVGNFLTL